MSIVEQLGLALLVATLSHFWATKPRRKRKPVKSNRDWTRRREV